MMTFYGDHILSIIVEEVALEGLDGITLEALWVRLNDRSDFPLKPKSDAEKNYIWKIVSKMSMFDFYKLPEPRKPLVVRSPDYAGEIGQDEQIEDIYPYCLIDDQKTKNIGSCSTYYTRIIVTEFVRNITLDLIRKDWGENSIVAVADQDTRRSVLFPKDMNPLIEVPPAAYSLLERIGRSRQRGECSIGPIGLLSCFEDAKNLFYHRKVLLAHKLVTKQSCLIPSRKQYIPGHVLHLMRYSVPVVNKAKTDEEKLINYLKSKPKMMALMSTMYKDLEFTRPIVKNILCKSKNNHIVSDMVPYREMYPGAPPGEYKTKNGDEKVLRIIKIVPVDERTKSDSESEGEDPDDEGDEDEGVLDSSRVPINKFLLRTAYSFIEKQGSVGLSQTLLAKLLAVSSLQSRTICRVLTKKKVCNVVFRDIARQRTAYYYCSKFPLLENKEFDQERCKLLQLVHENLNENKNTSNSSESVTNPSTAIAIVENPTSKNKYKRKKQLPQVPPSATPPKKIKLVAPRIDETVDESVEKPTIPTNPQVDEVSSENKSDEPTKVNLAELNQNFSIEISESNPPSRSPQKPLLTVSEQIEHFQSSPNASSSKSTLRILKRTAIILQAVNNMKIIPDVQKLVRMISEEEEAEGLSITVDRKSLVRLLDKLQAEGLVKTISVLIKGHGKEKKLNFICHPSIMGDHSMVQSLIEQAKLKMCIIPKDSHNKLKSKELKYPYDKKAGAAYGLQPKCVRMQMLHILMFYLVYGYDGKADLDQTTSKKEIIRRYGLEDSAFDELPTVYSIDLDWYTFIPPLPPNEEFLTGWVNVSDILLRIPLCLFVSLFNVSYAIPELTEYLKHPVKKYYLVKHIPTEVACCLTADRKCIYTLIETIQRLGYAGLVQFGPLRHKEKDQTFVYLNQHAILFNTTTSRSSYLKVSDDVEYEELHYFLESLKDVQLYWYDLWNFALHTDLGNRLAATGTTVVVEKAHLKEALQVAIQPKEIDEVIAADVGYLPGDRRGAAGFDSDLFVHLYKNWYNQTSKPVCEHRAMTGSTQAMFYPPAMKYERSDRREKEQKRRNSLSIAPPVKVGISNLKARQYPTLASRPLASQASLPDQGISKISEKTKISAKRRLTSKKPTKHSRGVRTIKPRMARIPKKPYYDAKDREALKKMKKLRVSWTPAEDNLLLLCKVAIMFMSRNKRRHVMNNNAALREILHEVFPETSENKTSRACRRRILYMMKNPLTVHSVYLSLTEAQQDPDINARFGTAITDLDERIRSQKLSIFDHQSEYDAIFRNLVLAFMSKLSNIADKHKSSLGSFIIPDSLESLYDQYDLKVAKTSNHNYYSEVNNIVDIVCSVVNSIYISSMCAEFDKTNYSYQLFYVYQQYPDSLLRAVMSKCRNLSIIVCRKKSLSWQPSIQCCLPHSLNPFQLSNIYVYNLMCKFPYALFHESYKAFRSMYDRIQQASFENVELEAMCGGECATVAELFSVSLINLGIELPSQIILLDTNVLDSDDSCKIIMNKFQDLLKVVRLRNPVTVKDEQESRENEPDDPSLTNSTACVSRLALYMSAEESPDFAFSCAHHAHDYFVLKPCKLSVKINRPEEINNLIQSCQTEREKIISEIKNAYIWPVRSRHDEKVTSEFDCRQGTARELLSFLESKADLGATGSEIEARFDVCLDWVRDILNTLLHKQHILKSGLINVRYVHHKYTKHWLVRSYFIPKNIRQNWANLSLDLSKISKPEPSLCLENENHTELACLKDVQELSSTENAESGIPLKKNRRTRIAGAKAKVEMFNKVEQAGLRHVQILMRPWIRIDGTLNRRVLDQLLGSVLGCCLVTPGVQLFDLQQRLMPALQPVHTFELAQWLQRIGCLELYQVKKSVKPSLFTSRATLTKVAATGFEDPASIVIETTVLAIFKFGNFIGEKSYSFDYFETILARRINPK